MDTVPLSTVVRQIYTTGKRRRPWTIHPSRILVALTWANQAVSQFHSGSYPSCFRNSIWKAVHFRDFVSAELSSVYTVSSIDTKDNGIESPKTAALHCCQLMIPCVQYSDFLS